MRLRRYGPQTNVTPSSFLTKLQTYDQRYQAPAIGERDIECFSEAVFQLLQDGAVTTHLSHLPKQNQKARESTNLFWAPTSINLHVNQPQSERDGWQPTIRFSGSPRCNTGRDKCPRSCNLRGGIPSHREWPYKANICQTYSPVGPRKNRKCSLPYCRTFRTPDARSCSVPTACYGRGFKLGTRGHTDPRDATACTTAKAP